MNQMSFFQLAMVCMWERSYNSLKAHEVITKIKKVRKAGRDVVNNR